MPMPKYLALRSIENLLITISGRLFIERLSKIVIVGGKVLELRWHSYIRPISQ